MKRYYITASSIPKLKSNISCIGNFDASHKGHQALYKKTISLAKKNNKNAYLITFDKDPNTVLFNESPLYSLKTRLSLYESFGFDGVIIIKTNKNFFSLTGNQFINKYLLKLNIDYLVTGFDFKYGKDSKSNQLLKKYFDNMIIIKPIKYRGKKISTQRIKKCIQNNNYLDANRMLGYEFKK